MEKMNTAQTQLQFTSKIMSCLEQNWILYPVLSARFRPRLTSNCSLALDNLRDGLQRRLSWALRILGSSSKLSTGPESELDVGQYDICLNVVDDRFRGRYCLLQLQKKEEALQEVEFVTEVSYHEKTLWGICVPSACGFQDAKKITDTVLGPRTLLSNPMCSSLENDIFSKENTCILVILSLVLFLILISTLVDLFCYQNRIKYRDGVAEVLTSFSVLANIRCLQREDFGSDNMASLRGIRVISLLWLIFAQAQIWTPHPLVRKNDDPVSWQRSLVLNELVSNAHLLMDNFIFLSGLLTSYYTLESMEIWNGKINLLAYVFFRYFRLFPALAVVVCFLVLVSQLESGPVWNLILPGEADRCRVYWWTSLMMIANWRNPRTMCLFYTWYMNVDYQLHVMSLPVVYVLYRFPLAGYFLCLLLVIASSVTVSVLTINFGFDFTPPFYPLPESLDELTTVQWQFWTHAGPYVVGIICGKLILTYRHIEINKILVVFLWFLTLGLFLLPFIFHRIFTVLGSDVIWTTLYAGIYRLFWPSALSWLTFALYTQRTGPLSVVLSWSGLVPFSKLTYCAYLTHGMVLWFYEAQRRDLKQAPTYIKVYEYFGHVMMTYLCALALYLCSEAPFSRLANTMFSRWSPTNKVTVLRSRSAVDRLRRLRQ